MNYSEHHTIVQADVTYYKTRSGLLIADHPPEDAVQLGDVRVVGGRARYAYKVTKQLVTEHSPFKAALSRVTGYGVEWRSVTDGMLETE